MTENQRDNFEDILGRTRSSGHADLTDQQISRLSLFYAIVMKWNERLHLTTITEPTDFVERHVAEAVFACDRIPEKVASIWDLGTGLGVPGIPLAILRPDLTVNLVEAGRKKAIYLEEAVSELRLDNARVICRRIEELDPLPSDAILTARAVEKMESLLSILLRLGADCPSLLLFGGRGMAETLEPLLSEHQGKRTHPLPGAESRLLIEIYRST